VKLTCANAGKVACLAARFTPDKFAVFSGQSDWLIPCLIGGGVGCVTGIANCFPRSVQYLHRLWTEGKIDEARKLQGQIALAEQACKKGLAATKYGAGYFTGPEVGLHDAPSFYPRKPYQPATKEVQQATIRMMEHLVELEKSLPDVRPCDRKKSTN